MRRFSLLAALAVAALSPLAQAEYRNDMFNQNYVWETEKPWEEKTVELPAYPDGKHWQEFEVGPTTRNRHAVDTATLRLDDDGVVRFAVRVQSPDGAETLTYDGLRCETREHKRYAIGADNKTWALRPARRSGGGWNLARRAARAGRVLSVRGPQPGGQCERSHPAHEATLSAASASGKQRSITRQCTGYLPITPCLHSANKV
ncbi:MAG: CNP1-like family protein [Rivihabitans pingtungensis]